MDKQCHPDCDYSGSPSAYGHTCFERFDGWPKEVPTLLEAAKVFMKALAALDPHVPADAWVDLSNAIEREEEKNAGS